MLWATLEGWRQGSVRMPVKSEGWSCYKNSVGADSPKSALETEDHVRELNISTLLMSCIIRDDLHMRVHRYSKGHILMPALKVIQWTRAEHLLQCHAKSTHKNILIMDENIFTIEVKENVLRLQGGHHPSYVMVWLGVSHQGVTPLLFCKKGVKLVPDCIKRMCYKSCEMY